MRIKPGGDSKMGISSVEGFDRDAKFVCEKGMTGHVADEIGGIAVGIAFKQCPFLRRKGHGTRCFGVGSF